MPLIVSSRHRNRGLSFVTSALQSSSSSGYNLPLPTNAVDDVVVIFVRNVNTGADDYTLTITGFTRLTYTDGWSLWWKRITTPLSTVAVTWSGTKNCVFESIVASNSQDPINPNVVSGGSPGSLTVTTSGFSSSASGYVLIGAGVSNIGATQLVVAPGSLTTDLASQKTEGSWTIDWTIASKTTSSFNSENSNSHTFTQADSLSIVAFYLGLPAL